jgi:tetratricopeptide (TPR) repeat protein
MRRSLALTLLLALGTAANLFAIGEARVNGKVTDAVTKAPLPDAKVSMTSSKGAGRSFKAEYKVDKDGNYAIFVLDGTIKYDIVYSAPGHTSEVFNEVKLTLGDTTKKDVALQPANAAAATGEKAKAPTADPAVVAFNEGAHLANEGKDDEAIAKMEEAVAAKPELIAGHSALATLYLRKKAYPKAIASANKVLEYDTDNADMAEILYSAYMATGDKAKAAEYKKKMPVNAGVLFNDAVPLLNAGKYNEAEKILKEVVAADPKFARAYYHLGIIGMQKGDNASAKANFQKYLELDPNGTDADVAREALKSFK